MTKLSQFTVFLIAILLFSCKNDVLKKTKTHQLHLAIIHNGDSIVPFWNTFQKKEAIEIIPHYYTLNEFLKNADSLTYNFKADVIWIPSINGIQTMLAKDILQPLSQIKNEKTTNLTDESKKWFIVGYDPYIVTTDKPVNSYSDLKANGKWNTKLNQAQESHFYSFAKLHFNSTERFEKWKEEMESNKTSIKNNDSVIYNNKTLSLLSIERKNGNSNINKQGIALFYDITAIGAYRHCKNYISAMSFINWMISDKQLVKIAEKNNLVAPNFNNNNTTEPFKFHRIKPNYLIQHVK